MIDVGINGYGTIGKRVADAVEDQPDMRIRGVAKRSPNYEAETAIERGYPLFVADPDRADDFAASSIPLAGTLEELLEGVDVVVDATPAGVGRQNRSAYRRHDVRAIYQGGEDPDVAGTSFNARANYPDATGAEATRVVSCNTTGLARLLAPLVETYGVESATVTLVRRGGDPDQSDRGPINDILPDPVTTPSHHGPDLLTVLPGLDVRTMGIKVPATLMHVHSVQVTLESETTRPALLDRLSAEPRLSVLPGTLDVDGCGSLRQYALDRDRPRGDMWENCIWEESVSVEGRSLQLFQAIHQVADVVPENVDAIRALTGTTDATNSRERTNQSLGIAT